MNENSKFMIADLSDDDKPREKAIRLGVRALSDAELLAIVFGGGTQGKSVIDLSREVLSRCDNSLTRLAKMSVKDLSRQFNGIGPVKAVTLQAALELGFRCRDENHSRDTAVRTSADAYAHIRRFIENLPHEEFWVMVLSRSNRIVHTECISRGGTVATYVEPKMIVRVAIDHLASGIILAHNHPSGNILPSSQDDTLTQRIKNAAELLDIRVLDHIVVGENDFYSYADHGRI